MASLVDGGFSVDWNSFLASDGGGMDKGYSSTSTSYVMPRQNMAASPSVTSIGDGLTGAISNIFSSFTTGISNAIGMSAASIGNYLSGGDQTLVGYDRYNNPIYSYRDPRTGAVYTGSTPGYPGAPGSSSQFIERTPTSRDGTGLWGWVTNLLSTPAPRPYATIGTIENEGISPLDSNGAGGFSASQLLLAAGIAAGVFIGIRVLTK